MGLAGCINHQPPAEQEDGGQGLGLEIPDVLPEPGPFREPAEALERFERFILEDGASILEECGAAASAFPALQQSVEEGVHVYGLWIWLLECDQPESRRALEMSKQAIEEDRVLEVRDELMARADEQRAAMLETLERYAEPGDAVEATFLRFMVDQYVGKVQAMQRAEEWSGWTTGQADNTSYAFGVERHFLNLIAAREVFRWAEVMMSRYPWSDSSCLVPDIDTLEERVRGKLDRAIALWRASPYPEDASNGAWGKQLENWDMPRLDAAAENGWWVASLGLESRVEVRISYWENRTTPGPLPTLEEAEYLIALQRHAGRTLRGEDTWYDTLRVMNDPRLRNQYDWQNDSAIGAQAVMARLYGAWSSAEPQCAADDELT